jgi:hypothetical protein
MTSINPGFGIEAVDAQAALLAQQVVTLQGQIDGFNAQMAALNTFFQSTPARLNGGASASDANTIDAFGIYYLIGSATTNTPLPSGGWRLLHMPWGSPGVEYDGQIAFTPGGGMFFRNHDGTNWGAWVAWGLSVPEMDVRYAAKATAAPMSVFLAATTVADMRTALGLGSAATASAGDFEPAGSLAATNAMTPADVDERARDAVGAALTIQNALIYGRSNSGFGGTGPLVDAQFSAGLAWQLRAGSTLISSGAAGAPAPATGLSIILDDTANKILLRDVSFWNDPNASGVGGETGGAP